MSKRGVVRWLSEGNEARWMVDDAFIDIVDWMKNKYPQPMHPEPESSGYESDDESSYCSSLGHDTIN